MKYKLNEIYKIYYQMRAKFQPGKGRLCCAPTPNRLAHFWFNQSIPIKTCKTFVKLLINLRDP